VLTPVGGLFEKHVMSPSNVGRDPRRSIRASNRTLLPGAKKAASRQPSCVLDGIADQAAELFNRIVLRQLATLSPAKPSAINAHVDASGTPPEAKVTVKVPVSATA
jgi:hypothetical protein